MTFSKDLKILTGQIGNRLKLLKYIGKCYHNQYIYFVLIIHPIKQQQQFLTNYINRVQDMKSKVYNSSLSPYESKKKKSSENLPHFRNYQSKDYSERNIKKQPKNYSRPVHFVSDELERNQTQGSEDYQGRRYRDTAPHGFKKEKRSFGVQRISQLKDMVDNIISDCKIESKEVKQGLQQIKQYQLDVLQELQEDYDSAPQYEKQSDKESERNQRILKESNGYRGSDSKIMEQVITLREQKLNLMKELNEEIRKNNELTREIKKLENANTKLKRQLDRSAIKPNRLDETENYQNQSIINKLRGEDRPLYKLERQNAKLREEITRLHDFKKNSEDQDQIDSLKKQISHLTEEVNAAEQEIKRLNRKLTNKQSTTNDKEQIKRLNEIIQLLEDKNNQLEQRLRKNGDLLREFAKLKQQNEQLRVETIRLLKKKQSSQSHSQSHSHDVQLLQDQIMKLHDNIEKQNIAKKKFLDDVSNYKRQFNEFERQNRMLKDKNEQLNNEIRRLKSSSANYYTSQVNPVSVNYGGRKEGIQDYDSDYLKKYNQYQRKSDLNVQDVKPTSTYDQMANVLLDERNINNEPSKYSSMSPNFNDKLEKYKSALSDLRNVRSGRAS